MTYSTADYYNTANHVLVCQAHQELVWQYRPQELNTVEWYWAREPPASSPEHRQEQVGPFKLHAGPLSDIPLPLVALYLDSQIKTYMDRDALGEAVRQGARIADGTKCEALRVPRERELARRIGGAGLQSPDIQIAVVEYNGYVVGGMMVQPGNQDETVAAIMESAPKRARSMAALQANFTLPAGDPLLLQKEREVAELFRYFRVTDQLLKRILPSNAVHRKSYRRTAHLIRALTISEAFAVTSRWAEKTGRRVVTCLCETPNDDVKSLIEGKRLKTTDGEEIRLGGIPHRRLTSAAGVEFYPAAYRSRPEGTTKIYSLYAFDFDEIASRAKVYRAEAVAAYQRETEGELLDGATVCLSGWLSKRIF